jgi:hypothetical protein
MDERDRLWYEPPYANGSQAGGTPRSYGSKVLEPVKHYVAGLKLLMESTKDGVEQV